MTDKNKLTVTDQRTGKSYDLPIEDGAIRATDLRQIRVDENDRGLCTYDPAYLNTAICKSSITYLNGEEGILRYRGYAIDQLAENSNFMETAYLLVRGELPTQAQYDDWCGNIAKYSTIRDQIKTFIDGFVPEAHPMRMLIASIAAVSSFYPEVEKIEDPEARDILIYRLIGKISTLSAYVSRRHRNLPYVNSDPTKTYTFNFMNMVFKGDNEQLVSHPVIKRALNVLFILHADHEQSCSTSSLRNVGSSRVDPFSAIAAAAAALYGPLHGGANEAVLKMLRKIGSKDKVPDFIKSVKAGEGRLMGFGHRVYKSYDPRAKIIKKMAYDVFGVTGTNPLLDIALELERIALEDNYFVSRKLYPNVDFYSGLIYQSMGFPEPMFPVLFALGRTAGWAAQWLEMITDPEQKISRPRQIYTGSPERAYQTMVTKR